jgi:hypothetical protein
MHRRILSLLVLGVFAAAPSALSAQISTGISLAGGIALPQGDFGKGVESGYNAALGLNIGAILLPVGVRLEGAYNGFKVKNLTTGSADTRIISGTANVTLGMGLPYVIAGLGYYDGKTTLNGTALGSGSGNGGSMGYNVGGGVRLPLGVMTTFVEARYHKMTGSAKASYIPITFGVQF